MVHQGSKDRFGEYEIPSDQTEIMEDTGNGNKSSKRGKYTPERFEMEEETETKTKASPERTGGCSDLGRLSYWKDLLIGCSAELVGTAMYLYVCILTNQPGDVFGAAFSAGGTICLLIIAFANISGAHFNPVASLGFFAVGEISLVRLIFYVASQVCGSLIGAYSVRGVLSESYVYVDGLGNITQFEAINGGAHFLQAGIPIHLAIIAECIYSFNMMLVVYMVAVDSKTKSSLAPIAVGFIITICILSGWKNTSGSFNPARSFGAAMAVSYYRPDVWTGHYVFWIGPSIGALVSALLYRLLYADEQHKITRQILKIV